MIRTIINLYTLHKIAFDPGVAYNFYQIIYDHHYFNFMKEYSVYSD